MINKVEQNQDTIIERLTKKATTMHCPMCNNQEFSLGPGVVPFFLQDNIGSIQIGGQNLPAIYVICKKCGFISFHAVGVLELFDELKADEDAKGGQK